MFKLTNKVFVTALTWLSVQTSWGCRFDRTRSFRRLSHSHLSHWHVHLVQVEKCFGTKVATYLQMRKVESLLTLIFPSVILMWKNDKEVTQLTAAGKSRVFLEKQTLVFLLLFVLKVQSDHKFLHLGPINNWGSVCTKGSSDCGQTADTCVFESVEVQLRCCTSGFFPKVSRNRKSDSVRLIIKYAGWREQYSVFSREMMGSN